VYTLIRVFSLSNKCHSIVSSAYRRLPPSNLGAVTLALQLEGVLADPSGAAGASLGLVEALAVAKTSMLLTGRGKTSAVTSLMDGITYPVHTRIIPDLVLCYINHDDLVILVSSVLGNPVAVQHSQALQPVTNTLLSNSLEVSVRLLFIDGTRSLGLTISVTFGNGTFSASTTHAHSVDTEADLVLIAKLSSFVRAGRAGSTVHPSQLAIMPGPDTQQIPHNIALLFLVQLRHIPVRSHYGYSTLRRLLL